MFSEEEMRTAIQMVLAAAVTFGVIVGSVVVLVVTGLLRG